MKLCSPLLVTIDLFTSALILGPYVLSHNEALQPPTCNNRPLHLCADFGTLCFKTQWSFATPTCNNRPLHLCADFGTLCFKTHWSFATPTCKNRLQLGADWSKTFFAHADMERVLKLSSVPAKACFWGPSRSIWGMCLPNVANFNQTTKSQVV